MPQLSLCNLRFRQCLACISKRNLPNPKVIITSYLNYLRIKYNSSPNIIREKGQSQIMTATKRYATAPSSSSFPPPNLHRDKSTMAAEQWKTASVAYASVAKPDDHVEHGNALPRIPDNVELQDTLPTLPNTTSCPGPHTSPTSPDEKPRETENECTFDFFPTSLVAPQITYAQRQFAQLLRMLIKELPSPDPDCSCAHALPLDSSIPVSAASQDSNSGQPPPLPPTSGPLEEPLSFEAVLRAGPNPAPKVEQAGLPAKPQQAAYIPLGSTPALVPDGSSSVVAPPIPMAELLTRHDDFVQLLEESQKIAETLGVTQGAFLAALEKVKADRARAKAPLTAAEKEAANAMFWRTAAIAGLKLLCLVVLNLFCILSWELLGERAERG